MDKNQTEKDRLFKWACENFTKDSTENVFTPIKKGPDSYYEKVENKEYIRAYDPDTAADIKRELSFLWKGDRHNREIYEQVKTICTVACMKNKNPERRENMTVQDKQAKQLKPFIYQF